MPDEHEEQRERERDDFRRFVRDQLRDIKDDISRIIHVIDGNGDPGIKVKVDRLERSDRMRHRLEWAVIFTIVVALTGMLVKAITKT